MNAGQVMTRDSHPVSGHCLAEMARSVIGRGACLRFRACGTSMNPFIRNGDILTLAPIGNRKPSIGHIVAFSRAGRPSLTVHRIIGKDAEGYRLKGDNLPTVDGTIPGRHILARVVSVERGGKNRRFGTGPERFVIAFLQRHGLFRPMTAALGWLYRLWKAQARAIQKVG